VLKAFPVYFDPTVEQIEKAGFLEKHACIVWLSSKDLIDIGKDFDSFDELRDSVIIGNQTYVIANKNKVTQIGGAYLYYVLGLNKK